MGKQGSFTNSGNTPTLESTTGQRSAQELWVLRRGQKDGFLKLWGGDSANSRMLLLKELVVRI